MEKVFEKVIDQASSKIRVLGSDDSFNQGISRSNTSFELTKEDVQECDVLKKILERGGNVTVSRSDEGLIVMDVNYV